MCDLSAEYGRGGRQQMHVVFYGAACSGMTVHLFQIHSEPHLIISAAAVWCVSHANGFVGGRSVDCRGRDEKIS